MKIGELYGPHRPVFSFEFFPPRTDASAESLLATIADLKEALAPDFVSVTSGAGAATRARTWKCVTRIQREMNLTAMAHLTCAGHSRAEIRDIAQRLAADGIENTLALRGDPLPEQASGPPSADRLHHANELIAFLADAFPMGIGGACYPETHPEAMNAEEDLHWARVKQDAGASFLITQLFFDNRDYFDFVRRARAAGIHVPIVPGIMPVTNVAQTERFTRICGAKIPAELLRRLNEHREEPETVMAIGIEHAIMQCRRLLEGGAPGLHFFTLNKSYATRSILAAVKRL